MDKYGTGQDPYCYPETHILRNRLGIQDDALLAQAERDLSEIAASQIDYSFALIDCPPALGLLTLNALIAADAVLVPLQCEFFALEGLSQLLKTVERVRRNFNPDLDLNGVVLTMFDKRNNLSDQVAADARDNLGHKVFDTVIPRNVRVSEAPSHGKPALLELVIDPEAITPSTTLTALRAAALKAGHG